MQAGSAVPLQALLDALSQPDGRSARHPHACLHGWVMCEAAIHECLGQQWDEIGH